MIGIKPDSELWSKVNHVILGENMAVVLVTFVDALCQMLISSGLVKTDEQARVHLAAILLSPDTSDKPGSLVPLLRAELARIDDGKFLG